MKTPIFVGIITAALLANNPNTAFGIAEGLSCPAVKGGQISSSCQLHEPEHHSGQISQTLFDELQELARLVDVSYCVGSTGLREPFDCLNHCKEFGGFELVTVSPSMMKFLWPKFRAKVMYGADSLSLLLCLRLGTPGCCYLTRVVILLFRMNHLRNA